MLHYIKGLLVCKLMGSAVIETGGIGFEVGIPSNSRLYMTEDGSPVTIYTYMNVREDDISLFGFDDEEGLNLFKNLITVNGVGAKAAMAILSALPASEVVKAIVCEDTEVLATACEGAHDGGSCDHFGGYEVGAAAGALAAFEVSVAG